MTDAPAPRWPVYATLGLGTFGALTSIGGLIFVTGSWRSSVDADRQQLNTRVGAVEAVQQANLPDFYGMKHDVNYLTERARRDDETRGRR